MNKTIAGARIEPQKTREVVISPVISIPVFPAGLLIKDVILKAGVFAEQGWKFDTMVTKEQVNNAIISFREGRG